MVATRQNGFILATTVWMVAILAILAGLFHSYVEAEVARALALKQRVQAGLNLESTGTTVRYLLSTRRSTLAGITVLPTDQSGFITADGVADISPVGNEIKLDGSVYKGLGSTYFSVQDEAGLLGLNSPSTEAVLQEVLRKKVDNQRARELAAALADYVDENQRKRFNGAEALQYQGSGLPGPTNWFLRSEAEMTQVLGWSSLLRGEAAAQMRNLFAITHANVLNVNTAPPLLLQLLLDLDASQAQELVDARDHYPFRSLDGVAHALGVLNRWESNRFRFYSGDRLHLKYWCADCEYTMVQSIELTPDGFYGPWLMDYSYTDSRKRGNSDDEPAVVAGSLFSDPLLAGR